MYKIALNQVLLKGVCVSVGPVHIASVYKAGTLLINEKTEANKKGDFMLDVTTVEGRCPGQGKDGL